MLGIAIWVVRFEDLELSLRTIPVSWFLLNSFRSYSISKFRNFACVAMSKCQLWHLITCWVLTEIEFWELKSVVNFSWWFQKSDYLVRIFFGSRDIDSQSGWKSEKSAFASFLPCSTKVLGLQFWSVRWIAGRQAWRMTRARGSES